MMEHDKRKSVDLLVDQFWKQGYSTVSRKFGTYLPEPGKVGNFDIDIVARYKKNYAIGIALTEGDIKDPRILEKLSFLATRQTKYTNKRVLLFVGIPQEYFKMTKEMIDFLEHDARKNIRLFPIVERAFYSDNNNRRKELTLFS
ncbi:MAG TPA: hypothetical protein VKA26_01505 [Ignavibacteriaceae bacterium]|nr:hypothetical protein [Ignavibacteriaceae bacterium]